MTSSDHENPIISPTPKLGVGKIISNTFVVYLNNFLLLFSIPFFVHAMEQSLIYFAENSVIEGVSAQNTDVFSGITLLGLIILYPIKSFLFSVLTLIAFDLTSGKRVRTFSHFRTAIIHFFPLLMLYFGYTILTGLGFVLLILPGLYLMAKWSVYLPANLAEHLTAKSLNRSADLTEHYCWPIMVPLTLFIGVAAAAIMILSYLSGIGTDEFLIPDSTNEWWQFIFINSTGDSIGEGLFSVGSVVIYSRLLELKEGELNDDALSAVFD